MKRDSLESQAASESFFAEAVGAAGHFTWPCYDAVQEAEKMDISEGEGQPGYILLSKLLLISFRSQNLVVVPQIASTIQRIKKDRDLVSKLIKHFDTAKGIKFNILISPPEPQTVEAKPEEVQKLQALNQFKSSFLLADSKYVFLTPCLVPVMTHMPKATIRFVTQVFK